MTSQREDTRKLNSYRGVVRVSLPLVVSMTTTVVMTFTDRIFLANYSIDAIAAALPAGITEVIIKALQKKPYMRFADAQQMLISVEYCESQLRERMQQHS